MVAASVHRSPARESGFTFRMTAEDKERFRALAARHGMTMQAYLEHVVFGREEPPRRSGPCRHDQESRHDPQSRRQQELPLS